MTLIGNRLFRHNNLPFHGARIRMEAIPSSAALPHVFSGYSIWLVPGSSSSPSLYSKTIETIIKQNTPASKPPFQQHVTLFYNFSLPSDNDAQPLLEKLAAEIASVTASTTAAITTSTKKTSDTTTTTTTTTTTSDDFCRVGPIPPHTPADRPVHFFHYAKHMDNNQGYSAHILYLTINSPVLQKVYAACTPLVQHERANHNDGKYIPHLALAYLSDVPNPSPYINEEATLRTWEQQLKPVHDPANGVVAEHWDIAVWSTKGTVDEWYEVARKPLST
jgi:hypothetical protein